MIKKKVERNTMQNKKIGGKSLLFWAFVIIAVYFGINYLMFLFGVGN